MNVIFPFLGMIAVWVGLEHFGPPKVYGEFNPPSILLWLIFTAFIIRFVMSLFNISPARTGGDDE